MKRIELCKKMDHGLCPFFRQIKPIWLGVDQMDWRVESREHARKGNQVQH